MEPSPCPPGAGWCTDPVEYPHRFVRQVMNTSHPLWPAMRENSHPHPAHPQHRPSHRHMRMLSLLQTSRPACELVESFLAPRAARNKNLEWRFIVNNEESEGEHQQVIRVGLCAATRECKGAWPGQVTQCRQLYLDHKLVVITRTGEVVLDYFSFPSCCSCHVLNLHH